MIKPLQEQILTTLLLILLSFLIAGCKISPGEGGTSNITGKIKIKEYNASGILINEYYAPDEDVFIIYGEDTVFDDATKTSYEGTYKFTFLRKGAYQIFAYSDCLTCAGFTEVKIVDVEISNNHEDITAPEIIIEKH
jgi:hypothetical protein